MTKKPNYKKGILNKNTIVAKSFITQRIVAKVFDLKLKNSRSYGVSFNVSYDLYDKNKYGKIDVKSSKKRRYDWGFKFQAKKEADTYICLGFDENRKNILHVWIIPNEDYIKNLLILTIYDNQNSLLKNKHLEVNSKPYNKILHEMSQKRKDTNGKECFLNNNDL